MAEWSATRLVNRAGYFADYEGIVQYCSASGAFVAEADGSLRLIPAASR
jgi:hypothetical protein